MCVGPCHVWTEEETESDEGFVMLEDYDIIMASFDGEEV